MEEYSIRQVMEYTGLSRTTILYYENKGLIKPRQEENSGYRKYTMDEISQIMFYQSLKPLGISVEEYGAALGSSESTSYKDVFDLILLKKADYMKRLGFYVAMWEETMTVAHLLREKKSYYQIQFSKEAWALKMGEKLSKNQSVILKNWKDYFLQRNLSYFFDAEKVRSGNYSFEYGLSCYADGVIAFDEKIGRELTRISGRLSLLYATSINLKDESFEDIFGDIEAILKQEKLVMNGDPWGNLGYIDEKLGEDAKNHIFIWVPVEADSVL